MHQIYCPKFWSRWLFCAILVLSLHSNAHSSQDSGRITLHITNQPIEKVFRQIENQTGYAFFYGHSILDPNTLVSINTDRSRLSQVMDILLKERNIVWRVKDNGIVLSKRQDTDGKIYSNLITSDTMPRVIIKGTVNSDEGFPLPGATIKIIGKQTGGTTNAKGEFTLPNIQDRSILVISYTGYIAQEFKISGSETLIVKLKRNINSLDEQVVIAYGTSTRRLLTGAVGKITAEEIGKQPVSNALAALQGRVPGLIVTQQTGVPGGGFRVSIRGTNSLRNGTIDYQNGTNGNDPLYIIDGIPYFSTPQSMAQISSSSGIYPIGTGTNPLNSINPSDIESVEILKDADATSIYGSRGANGVVMITTKKGRIGTMRVDANFYTGIGNVTRKMKLLNTSQYLEMRGEAFRNDGITTYPASAYDINGTWDKNRETDWQKELIGGTAHSTDGQLSISGGTINTQYRIGTGYHKETTVFPGDFSFERISTSLSLNNVSSNQKFKSSIVVSYSFGLSDLLSQDLTNKALKLSPNAPALYNNQGKLNFENSTFQNPLMYTKQPYNSKNYALITNATLNYEIINGLNLKLNLGYTNTIMKQSLKFPISSLDPNLPVSQKINSASFQNGTVSSWNIEPQLNYTKLLSDQHQLNFLIGTTFQRENSDALNQSATGFLSEALMDNIAAVPSANISRIYSNSVYSYNALFGRLNYNFRRKYIVNLSGRRDGSSRFGPSKQFANFGAIGAAWIFSEEEFMKEASHILSFGKLRASYGTTGSDQITNYGFQDTYTTLGAGQYQNMVGLKPTQLVNPDFSWEATKKVEAAMDLEFIENKLKISISHYRNRSSNQLVGYPLPSSTGFSVVQYNLPATVENNGWEFEMGTTNIKVKGISWSGSVNLSLPKNRLIEYDNLAGSSYATLYVIGEPLAIKRVYRYINVDPITGIHVVEDVDKNNLYNISDRIINKFTGQKFNGGVTNSFDYRNFHLDFLFQFVKQVANNYILDFTTMPGTMVNFPIEVMNRWRVSGDLSSIQKFSASSQALAYSRFQSSEASLSDASYIRLKNVSISYNLPSSILKHIKLGNLRVYLNGQNLLTVTKYRGLDPETQGTVLPPLRLLTTGIQATL